MPIETAKYSPVSGSGLMCYEHDNIFMISSSTESFDLFKKYNQKFDYQENPLSLLKNVYHQIKTDSPECVLAKIYNQKIYIFCAGGTGAFVLREEKLVPLIKTADSDNATVSGPIKNRDKYLFLAKNGFSQISLADIEDSLKNPDIDQSISRLSAKAKTAMLTVDVSGLEKKSAASVSSFRPAGSITGTFKHNIVKNIDSILEKIPQKKIVVKSDLKEVPKQKRIASIVGGLLLVILMVSIYWGLKTDKTRKLKAEYEPQLFEAQHSLDEAIEIADLSPSRAQELILSARSQAFSLRDSGIDDDRLSNLIEMIKNNLGPIAGIYENEPQLFLDLSLISSDFVGNDISFSSDFVRVLDFDAKRLVGINIETKRTDIISGPEFLPNALRTFSYEGRSFILSTDGIREVTEDVELLIKPEWDPSQVLVESYTGNVYLVNKENGEILRYQGVRGGFLEPESWLGEGIEMNFSQAISMAIDGEIWVLESNGNIDRLSGGVPQRFNLQGERSILDQPVAIFTDDESDYLYILDKAKYRIAVFNKDGQYVGEYSSEKLANATDFIVDEDSLKALFLADSKLYSIELKHLSNENNQ